MWTAVKIGAIISAVLLTLAFVAILIFTTRPALVMGVGSTSLAHSIEKDQGVVFCQDIPGDDWRCENVDREIAYKVDVDWMGCWTAEQLSGPSRLEGCIELDDILTFD